MELRGKQVAESLRSDISMRVRAFEQYGTQPRMVSILVEGDEASRIYAESKGRVAESLGIHYEMQEFPSTVTEETLLSVIHLLNIDKSVHGIMVELPLPSHISTERITSAIEPVKDIDGLAYFNRLSDLTGASSLYPATPKACIRIAKHYGIDLEGKHVVLVGCGKTVGMPLMHLLLQERATVTACHAFTRDLRAHLRMADVAFVAVGHAGLIQPDMVHKDLFIVDAGINQTNDNRIVGDVAPEVAEFVAAMTPTPGGVGVVTTVQLFANLLDAVDLQHKAQ